MWKRKKIDVLVLARPDHSYQVYQGLASQKDLSFRYVTFGLLPGFLSFLHIPKARYVGRNAVILIRYTLLHTLYNRLHWTKSFDEHRQFERSLRFVLRRYEPRIIHYWPDYSRETVAELKRLCPDAVTLAEMYMPNPRLIVPEMEKLYSSLGIEFSNQYLKDYASAISTRFVDADIVMVPSRYVEDSMRLSFPDKNYHLLSYGLIRSPFYTYAPKTDPVRKFVFSGLVSLEKGSDILLDFFSAHPELELHVYGNISETQKEIFEPFSRFPNIVFHGSVSKTELFRAYQHIDAAIHPSRFDAYSLAVAEEIGSGLPVIVSDKTGGKYDILENHWGLSFSLDDESSLEKAVADITSLEVYNSFKKSIDESLNNVRSYSERILDFYHSILDKDSGTGLE